MLVARAISCLSCPVTDNHPKTTDWCTREYRQGSWDQTCEVETGGLNRVVLPRTATSAALKAQSLNRHNNSQSWSQRSDKSASSKRMEETHASGKPKFSARSFFVNTSNGTKIFTKRFFSGYKRSDIPAPRSAPTRMTIIGRGKNAVKVKTAATSVRSAGGKGLWSVGSESAVKVSTIAKPYDAKVPKSALPTSASTMPARIDTPNIAT